MITDKGGLESQRVKITETQLLTSHITTKHFSYINRAAVVIKLHLIANFLSLQQQY